MISRGFSLNERLVVVAITGLAAMATTTSLASNDFKKLDAAECDDVNHICLARHEVVRTGSTHGRNASIVSSIIRCHVCAGISGSPSYAGRKFTSTHTSSPQLDLETGLTDVVDSSVRKDLASLSSVLTSLSFGNQ